MSGRIDRIKTIELAERHVKAGKLKEAIAEYERLAGSDPQDVGTLNIIGDLHMRLGQNDKAVLSFMKVAEEYEKRGLFSQALAIYRKVSKVQPDNADVSLKLGDLYGRQGFLSDAKNEYTTTAARFVQEKKFQEAIHVYEKVCSLDREDLGLKKELADLYRGQGYLDAALEQLNEIAGVRAGRGELDAAEEILKEARAISPGDSKTLVNLIELYKRSNKSQKAIELIEESLRQTPDNVQLMNLLGNFYFEAGDMARAEEIFAAIVTGHPMNVNARIKLGRIQILKDKLDQAYELFEPLIGNLIKKHKDEKAIGLLGLILESQKPHLPALERLASIYRVNKETKKLEVVARAIADELRRGGPAEKLLPVLTELHQLRPDDVELGREFQKLRKEMGLPDEAAAEEFPEVSGKEREAIQEVIDQADLYMQQGLVRNARRILENLTLRYPDDQQILKKIAVLDEIRTHIDEDELRRRVEKASALESRIRARNQREDRQEDKPETKPETEAEAKAAPDKKVTGPFPGDIAEGEKVSTADIFAETDIVPFGGLADGERKYYDLKDRAAEELRMLKAAFGQQVQGAMTQEERELSNIVADFRQDLKAKVTGDNNEMHYHLGIAFMEQSLYAEAIEEYSEAARDKGLALECFSLISYCHKQKQRYQDAEKWIKKAILLAREGTDQYYALEFELAEIFEQASNRANALSLFREIRDWNPDFRNISVKVRSLEAGTDD